MSWTWLDGDSITFQSRFTNARCCEYSDMSSWWWVEVPLETCRVVYKHKQYIAGSCWTITGIYFTMHKPLNVKLFLSFREPESSIQSRLRRIRKASQDKLKPKTGRLWNNLQKGKEVQLICQVKVCKVFVTETFLEIDTQFGLKHVYSSWV